MAVRNLRDCNGQGKDPAFPFQSGRASRPCQFSVYGGSEKREIRGKGLPDAHLRQPL